MKLRISWGNAGIYLGCLTIVVHLIAILGAHNEIYSVYHIYIFGSIRILYDNSFGKLNFPFIYIVLPIFITTWIHLFFNIKNKLKSSKLVLALLVPLINLFGNYFFLFYFLWGMNYYRPSISQLLHWPNTESEGLSLQTELRTITKLAEFERNKISIDTQALTINIDWKTLEDTIRNLQVSLLNSWQQATPGRVRIRALYPKGSLLCISTAGVYIPYVCEGHVDPGIHILQWPFTLAHEMAHGYGWTDEGECNFLGMLTCMKSSDPIIRYSALLTYWRYLYYDIKEKDETETKTIFDQLPIGIMADLKAIRKNNDSYPEFMTGVRDVMYDAYLKLHGMPSGMNSYSDLVILMHQWKHTKDSFPLGLQNIPLENY